MAEAERKATFTPPSKTALLKVTVGALLGAMVLLFLVVLPAEYGVDPTGFGQAAGLTQLAESEEAEPAPAPAAPQPSEAAEGVEGVGPPGDYARFHDGPPRDVVVEISLNPFEEVEYKALVPEGEVMLYSWSIPEGQLYVDFHGEPTEGEWPEGYFLSYGEAETGSQQGSFVAPFTGHHGWYWLNINEEPVTVRLTMTGYFESHEELYRFQQPY